MNREALAQTGTWARCSPGKPATHHASASNIEKQQRRRCIMGALTHMRDVLTHTTLVTIRTTRSLRQTSSLCTTTRPNRDYLRRQRTGSHCSPYTTRTRVLHTTEVWLGGTGWSAARSSHRACA